MAQKGDVIARDWKTWRPVQERVHRSTAAVRTGISTTGRLKHNLGRREKLGRSWQADSKRTPARAPVRSCCANSVNWIVFDQARWPRLCGAAYTSDVPNIAYILRDSGAKCWCSKTPISGKPSRSADNWVDEASAMHAIRWRPIARCASAEHRDWLPEDPGAVRHVNQAARTDEHHLHPGTTGNPRGHAVAPGTCWKMQRPAAMFRGEDSGSVLSFAVVTIRSSGTGVLST